MKKFINATLVLAIGLTLQPSLQAGSHDKIATGKAEKSVSAATRLSYGEGCIVGNCTSGYGYYMYADGNIAIGKWSACSSGGGYCLNGAAVESNVDYFSAANWSDWIPDFGMTSWYDGYEYVGSFALSDDGYWYANGIGLEVNDETSYEYGSFVDADLILKGCEIYYADILREDGEVLLSLDDEASAKTRATCNEGFCTSGIGKKTYDNGYYMGDFVDNAANGFGIYVNNSGEVTVGRWVNHDLVEGYIYNPSANIKRAVLTVGSKSYVLDQHDELSVYSGATYLGEYCSLNENSDVPISSATAIQKMIANKSYGVDGLFFHYGSGAFDWIYVEKKGSYAAKLAGANSSGFFDWDFIHTASDPGFKYINVSSDGKTVQFGPLK
jgi:hypothetical protein